MNKDKYEESELNKGRCPECGSEGDKVVTVRRKREDMMPVPADKKGKCRECGYRSDPGEFKWSYKEKRLTEEELEKRKKKRQEWMDKKAEAENSADNISRRREP